MRRVVATALQVALLLIGVVAGLAANFLTSDTDHPPAAVAWVQRSALGILVGSVVLAVVAQVVASSLDGGSSMARSSPRPVWSAARNPYPGLRSFDEEDAAVFFGRGADVDRLVARVAAFGDAPASRVLTVAGASGVGKSSLVRAGLLPRLKGSRQWIVPPVVTPGRSPLHGLALALGHLLPDSDPHALATALAGPRGAAELVRLVDRLRSRQVGRPARVLLVVDQAEELLTLADERAAASFFAVLTGAQAADPGLCLVFVVRLDFMEAFLAGSYATLFQDPANVAPIRAAALAEVVEGPAAQAGLAFEPGLVARIVADTGSGEALPLLAFALGELGERAERDGLVRTRAYEESGGVHGALSRRADHALASLEPPCRARALPTLLRFVTLSEGAPARRPVRRDELDATERTVVDAFLAARLLTTADGDGQMVTVSHEALLGHWRPLADEIAGRAVFLGRLAELRELVHDWTESGRKHAYLIREERLRTVEQWLAQDDQLAEGADTRAFLEAARAADGETARRNADALAQQALDRQRRDPELGLLLALTAVEEYAPTARARRALASGLEAFRLSQVLRGHAYMVRQTAWSPDGRHIATAAHDRTVRMWSADNGSCVRVLSGHTDAVDAVCWSPDGQRLCSAGRDHVLRLWDAATGGHTRVLSGHTDRIDALAWSPDGRLLASGSADTTVRVWDADTGACLHVLTGHQGNVRRVDWPPDGRLASAGADGTVRIWGADRTRTPVALTGHRAAVTSVAWSPDGGRLASVSDDRTLRIWAADDASPLLAVPAHTDTVWDVAWSPDGRRLATASSDYTARVWDAQSMAPLQVLAGHRDLVWSVAWSPRGDRLVTGCQDSVARIWDVRNGTERYVMSAHEALVRDVSWSPRGTSVATASDDGTVRVTDAGTCAVARVLRGHELPVWEAKWSPDGRRLASAGHDRTARVWPVDGSAAPVVLAGHEDYVWRSRWSPDGRLVATASSDGTARLWHPDGDGVVRVLRGHEGIVATLDWSPDGRRLVTGSHDRTARIWDARTGEPLHVLRHHEKTVFEVAWSPDGVLVATMAWDHTVCLWEAATGRLLHVLRGHTDTVTHIRWSPGSALLATVSRDRTARLWDSRAGTVTRVLSGHDDFVRDLAWSPDGTQVVTGSNDCTIRSWAPAEHGEADVIGTHAAPVAAVAWSPDGRSVASVSHDLTLRVWDTARELPTLTHEARARLHRSLTAEERAEFGVPERRTEP
ncbi:nSTAND1 domain-containing NTPase [Streptomyces melanogenes]|uniref:nSTAND1 domain-containing NTPase n=1 Tax=Streptomyces melanogenes TaxID=67326 RepID=UPI003796AFC4